MYFDTPDPGGSYLVFNFLVVLFLLLIPFGFKMKDDLRKKLFLPVTVISMCGVVAFVLFLHAGFDTQYIMDDENIYIRNGLIQRTTIALESIEDVEREPLIWQPVGFTLKWKGFSNRYVDGISIKTRDSVIFLSPADTGRFLREIHVRIKRAKNSRRIVIPLMMQ